MKLVYVRFTKEFLGASTTDVMVFREDDEALNRLDGVAEGWAEADTSYYGEAFEFRYEIFTPTLEEFELIKEREEKRLLGIKSQMVDQIQKLSYLNEL